MIEQLTSAHDLSRFFRLLLSDDLYSSFFPGFHGRVRSVDLTKNNKNIWRYNLPVYSIPCKSVPVPYSGLLVPAELHKLQRSQRRYRHDGQQHLCRSPFIRDRLDHDPPVQKQIYALRCIRHFLMHSLFEKDSAS